MQMHLLPYKDTLIDNELVREFDESIDPIELMWHRDNEDRIISPVNKTDWKFQLENNLPTDIKEEIFIPRGVWHRIIKGTGSVKVKIIKK
jgi:hypothetical protein